MKKIIIGISLFILLLSVGCSDSNQASTQKTEEEIRTELRAEMEAEAKEKEELEAKIRAEIEAENKAKEEQEKQKDESEESNPKEIKKLSDEELTAKKYEYESKFFKFLDSFDGGFYTSDITEFEHYKNHNEFREYIDMLLALGYGFEQAEGRYYLYVGEPAGYTDGEVEEVKDDLYQGYTYKVEEDMLKLTYNNSGNTVVLVIPNEDTDPTKFIGDISNVNKSHNGLRLYFEIPAFATTNAIHYVDLETFEIKFFTDGWFIKNIGEYPFTNSVIIQKSYIDGDNGRKTSYFAYDSNGDEICNLGDKLEEQLIEQISREQELQHSDLNTNGNYNLKGFTNETINETQINYDEYVNVVIPMYNGVNKDNLTPHRWDIGPGTSEEVSFAVFGKILELVIIYQEGMDSDPITQEVGEVKDAMMTIKTHFPSDMSYIKIKGVVMGGEGHRNNIEFTLDDMRDLSGYKPITVKY